MKTSLFQRTQFIPMEEKSTSRWHQLLDWIGMRVAAAGTRWWVLVAGWAGVVYLLTRVILPGRFSAGIYLYLLQPALWLSLALLAGLGLAYGLWERPRASFPILMTAALIGLCQVAVFLMAGLIWGFGRSPYDHQPVVLLGNLFYAFSLLVGVEVCRAYLASGSREGNLLKVLLLVSLVFTLLNLPPGVFSRLDSLRGAVQVVGERFLPMFAQNLLATLLALLAGPLAASAYLGTLLAFEWLSPVLPNPGWFVNAFLGTIIPAVALLYVYNHFTETEVGKAEAEDADDPTAAWVVVGVLSVLILGFSTGLFGFRPTLIGSGSMRPALKVGDIVVVREVPIETIAVGDIVRFRDGRDSIVHRVVEVQHAHGQTILITRGDDNTTNDPPVVAQALEGKVVFTLPLIGWVAVFLRQGLALFL